MHLTIFLLHCILEYTGFIWIYIFGPLHVSFLIRGLDIPGPLDHSQLHAVGYFWVPTCQAVQLWMTSLELGYSCAHMNKFNRCKSWLKQSSLCVTTGAVCYPTCIVALSDPVVLANGSSADTVEHWMLPSKVQVRWSGRFAANCYLISLAVLVL